MGDRLLIYRTSITRFQSVQLLYRSRLMMVILDRQYPAQHGMARYAYGFHAYLRREEAWGRGCFYTGPLSQGSSLFSCCIGHDE